MSTRRSVLMVVVFAVVMAMIVPIAATAQPSVQITLLHTNDFHGNLETDYRSRGGSAYLAQEVNDIRNDVGAENVALLDAGDVYFAAPPISQLLMGESTIDIYNMIGYDVAAFGNHEFDKGQTELAVRVAQSAFPWLGANVVLEGTDWDLPTYAEPYELLDVGGITLGVLGLAGEETPEVTLLGTTEGLVFKDLTETILHYYDEVMGLADALVVLVHMGTADSGPYEGLETVAQHLIDAGKPVDLMIGGHQHEDLDDPVYVGDTAIVSAGYYGRWLGRVDITVDPSMKELSVDEYELISVSGLNPADPDVATRVAEWAAIVAPIVNVEVGQTNISLVRDYNNESTIGDIVADSMLWKADEYDDGDVNGSVDIALTNAGGLRADIEIPDGAELPYTVTWGDTFNVLPFGNTLYLMDLTGAQIQELLDQSASLYKGMLQTSGASWYWYNDTGDDTATAWGAYGVEIDGAPLERDEVYRVVTNNFTAGGQDGFTAFAEGTNRWDTYYDMQQGLVEYIESLDAVQLANLAVDLDDYYDDGLIGPAGVLNSLLKKLESALAAVEKGKTKTAANQLAAFMNQVAAQSGKNIDPDVAEMLIMDAELITFDGVIDAEDIPMDRIIRLDDVITMLHTNDTHGTWPETYYYGTPEGFAFLASLIKAERAHNPNVLLLDAGDTFQGNAFAQYFRNADPNPIAGGMNLLGYDAMTIGNHEFNFGPATFASMLGQLDASIPILGTINLEDDGSYGFINENVQDYINLDVNGKKVTIFGLTNPRVYRYELPTNIPGLTFYSGLDTGFEAVPEILEDESPDLMVGLTHMGYSPYGDEIDSDLLLAEGVAGIDVIIGGHSHSFLNPAVMVESDINPDGTLIAQSGRYALNLGQVNVGFVDGEIVLREGYLIPATEASVDAEMEAYLQPFLEELDAYTSTEIGQTTAPIDALAAYTQETSGANVQADAAVYELTANGIDVNFHLSGAMSNRAVAAGATEASPVTLTVGDMYTLMPYENSLLVMSMNGPQIKEVLERGYRNYWYYNYDPGNWGGYSHYTTCMLTTDADNVIMYDDPGAGTPPDGDNVVSLTIDGVPVDLTDATTYYNVSSVNYLAAGSCNFNNDGVTIWPLDQIVADTQFYVRDSVIDYMMAQVGPISPAVEGRLVFATP